MGNKTEHDFEFKINQTNQYENRSDFKEKLANRMSVGDDRRTRTGNERANQDNDCF